MVKVTAMLLFIFPFVVVSLFNPFWLWVYFSLFGCELWLQALSELHDQIPPFPRNVAMKIIEEEFGSPVESFFSYISKEPVAAASFGQVAHYSTAMYDWEHNDAIPAYICLCLCRNFLIWCFFHIRLCFYMIKVYRGSTLDGVSVAVKVQRPNLRHLVVRDVYILRLGVCIFLS